MKKFFRYIAGILALSILLGTGAAVGFAADGTVPGIIYVPWDLSPGDIGAVYGGYFADKDTTVVAVQPLTGAQSVAPDSAQYKLKPFNATEDFVQFEIPSDIPKDIWAIWVQNGTGWSEVRYTNRAILYWVNEHEIYAGQKLLLHGRNIANPLTRSAEGIQVKFTDADTKSEYFGQIYDITDFTVSFTAPKELETGHQYDISYTNGAGGALGWVGMEQPERERVTVVEENENTKYFNDKYDLNISWLSDINTGNIVNVKDFGAKGDGSSNDTSAVQMAVDKTALAGGGIVYFPNGTYMVDIINIGEKVALQGESRTGTVIAWTGNDSRDTGRTSVKRAALTPDDEPGYGETSKLLYTINSNVGVFDMTLYSEHSRTNDQIENQKRLIYGVVTAIAFYGGWDVWNDEVPVAGQEKLKSSDYVVKNVDIKLNEGSSLDIWSPRHVVVEDCNFDVTHYGMEIRGAEYNRIRNNTVKNVCRPIIMWQTARDEREYTPDRTWFEGNTLIGDNLMRKVQRGEMEHPGWQELGGATEHRGTDFEGDEMLFIHNTFEGTIGDNRDNSGEGFQGQTGACRIVDRVKAADENSIEATKDLSTVKIIPDFDYLVINDGAGVGQARKIKEVKGSTIYVEEPWDVVPDSTSVYNINGYIQKNLTIAYNNFNANNNKGSIHFYRCGYDSVIRDNLITDGGGIWMAGILGGEKRLDFQYFNDVDNNKVSGSSNKGHGWQGGATVIGPGMDGGIGTLVEGETEAYLSTLMYGIRIRHNELTGIGKDPWDKAGATQQDAREEKSMNAFARNSGIITSVETTAKTHPLAYGEIIDGNNVKNTVQGLRLTRNSFDTVIRNNDFTGNGKEIDEPSKSTNTTYLEGDGGKKLGAYERPEIDKSMLKSGSSSAGEDHGFGDDIYFEDDKLPDEDKSVFEDVRDHWARIYIEAVAAKGVIAGRDAAHFEPNAYVTRAEFAAMAVRALGTKEPVFDGAYYDVFRTDWYAPTMQAAKNDGLIDERLTQYNKVFPQNAITREEAATVIAAACRKKGKTPEALVNLEVFDDAGQITDWMKPAISDVYALDAMRGTDLHLFEPKKCLTRAEAAVLMYNLLKL